MECVHDTRTMRTGHTVCEGVKDNVGALLQGLT